MTVWYCEEINNIIIGNYMGNYFIQPYVDYSGHYGVIREYKYICIGEFD